MKKLVVFAAKKPVVTQRPVVAANTEASELYTATRDNIEDNFSYLLEGVDKLMRDGKEKTAVEIMSTLNIAVDDAINQVAESVATE